MSDQAYREQCVATTTEVASPVPSDDLAMARIRPLLKVVLRSVTGLGEDRNALGAFLFTWPSGFDDPGTPAVKLPKARGRPVHGLTLQCLRYARGVHVSLVLQAVSTVELAMHGGT